MDEDRIKFNNFLLEQTVAHTQEENEQWLAVFTEYLNSPESVSYCIQNITDPSSVSETIIKLSHAFITRVNSDILKQFSEAMIDLFFQTDIFVDKIAEICVRFIDHEQSIQVIQRLYEIFTTEVTPKSFQKICAYLEAMWSMDLLEIKFGVVQAGFQLILEHPEFSSSCGSFATVITLIRKWYELYISEPTEFMVSIYKECLQFLTNVLQIDPTQICSVVEAAYNLVNSVVKREKENEEIRETLLQLTLQLTQHFLQFDNDSCRQVICKFLFGFATSLPDEINEETASQLIDICIHCATPNITETPETNPEVYYVSMHGSIPFKEEGDLQPKMGSFFGLIITKYQSYEIIEALDQYLESNVFEVLKLLTGALTFTNTQELRAQITEHACQIISAIKQSTIDITLFCSLMELAAEIPTCELANEVAQEAIAFVVQENDVENPMVRCLYTLLMHFFKTKIDAGKLELFDQEEIPKIWEFALTYIEARYDSEVFLVLSYFAKVIPEAAQEVAPEIAVEMLNAIEQLLSDEDTQASQIDSLFSAFISLMITCNECLSDLDYVQHVKECVSLTFTNLQEKLICPELSYAMIFLKKPELTASALLIESNLWHPQFLTLYEEILTPLFALINMKNPVLFTPLSEASEEGFKVLPAAGEPLSHFLIRAFSFRLLAKMEDQMDTDPPFLETLSKVIVGLIIVGGPVDEEIKAIVLEIIGKLTEFDQKYFLVTVFELQATLTLNISEYNEEWVTMWMQISALPAMSRDFDRALLSRALMGAGIASGQANDSEIMVIAMNVLTNRVEYQAGDEEECVNELPGPQLIPELVAIQNFVKC